MSFAISDLFGIAAPSVGDVSESRQRKSIELTEPVRDRTDGSTICIAPKALVTVEATQRGKGTHALSAVAAGELAALSTVFITSKTRTENQTEFPDFDVVGRSYETLAGGDPAAPGNSTTPITAAGAGCPLVGIISVDVVGVTSFTITASVEEAEPVLNADGTFAHQNFYDPTHDFSLSGVGDFPPSLVLGTDGGLDETVAEFATGLVIVTETDEGQRADGESDWSVSGRHFPDAA